MCIECMLCEFDCAVCYLNNIVFCHCKTYHTVNECYNVIHNNNVTVACLVHVMVYAQSCLIQLIE